MSEHKLAGNRQDIKDSIDYLSNLADLQRMQKLLQPAASSNMYVNMLVGDIGAPSTSRDQQEAQGTAENHIENLSAKISLKDTGQNKLDGKLKNYQKHEDHPENGKANMDGKYYNWHFEALARSLAGSLKSKTQPSRLKENVGGFTFSLSRK